MLDIRQSEKALIGKPLEDVLQTSPGFLSQRYASVSSGSHDQIAVLNQREVIVNRVAIEVEPALKAAGSTAFATKMTSTPSAASSVRSSAMRITCALCATSS
jgi:two-component system cit operon sensor histidine kinase CitA